MNAARTTARVACTRHSRDRWQRCIDRQRLVRGRAKRLLNLHTACTAPRLHPLQHGGLLHRQFLNPTLQTSKRCSQLRDLLSRVHRTLTQTFRMCVGVSRCKEPRQHKNAPQKAFATESISTHPVHQAPPRRSRTDTKAPVDTPLHLQKKAQRLGPLGSDGNSIISDRDAYRLAAFFLLTVNVGTPSPFSNRLANLKPLRFFHSPRWIASLARIGNRAESSPKTICS